MHYGGATNDTSYLGGHVAHTGQLFFNDSMQDAIDALDPYVTHQVARTSDDEDSIYLSSVRLTPRVIQSVLY